MSEIHCPQCEKVLVNSTCRLVQDTCGHRKCRLCLLQDEDSCRQCKEKQALQCDSGAKTNGVIKYENSYTGVITSNIKSQKQPVQELNHVSLSTPVINCQAKVNSEALNSDKVYKSDVKSSSVKKRNYQTIIIPNHVTVSKDPVCYKCNVCNKVFSTKAHVKYHIHCKTGNKPFRCNECGKEFINKSHLEIHAYIHLGRKPYNCTICNKAFAIRSKLNRHKLLHGTVKPYICQQCGKSFRSKDSLRIHSYTHSGEKPYKCSECGASFNNSSNLNKHVVTHSKDKVHMCDQCGKRFKLKWALTVHKRSHLRLRPHTCSSCSKTFVNAKDLRRHELIHIDVKAYSCGICGVGFRRKDNLERHMRNTHPGKTAKPIKNIIKTADLKPNVPKTPVDNPNAIKVITAPPSSNKTPLKIDKPTLPFVNAPLKLAFKTSAFKNHYNIHRDYIEPPKIHPKPYDLVESVNICQRIMSPHSPPPARNVIRSLGRVDEKTSSEICQKIMSPFSNSPPHYETAFEHKKHAAIKNMKLKLPQKCTNVKSAAGTSDILGEIENLEAGGKFKSSSILGDVKPLEPVKGVGVDGASLEGENGGFTYTELKTVNGVVGNNAATSVIVKSGNNANQISNEMHWRRRTSQNLNLCLK